MSIKHTLALLVVMLIAQPVFAYEDMSSNDKPCMAIVKACLDAGYTRDGSEGKEFWKDCMEPLIMGKKVTGITVDAKDVKACRKDKINQLKKELRELQRAKR